MRTGGRRPERGAGWKYIAEQVSHHPPVSACYANAVDGQWEWWQTVQVNTFFRGKDLDIHPKGITHFRFPKLQNEHITFRKVRLGLMAGHEECAWITDAFPGERRRRGCGH